MDIELTKGADYLLCQLYKKYLERIADHVPERKAVYFGDAKDIYENMLNDWSFDSISFYGIELHHKGLFRAMTPGQTFVEGALTNDALLYMERRFERKADKVIHRIYELTSVLGIIKPI